MKRFKVYLAGAISGLNFGDAKSWRDVAVERLKEHDIDGYSPLRAKEYLEQIGNIENSYDTVGDFNTPLSTAKGIMTRDHYDVQSSDAVLVYLKGAERVSIGTVMEIAWAFAYRKPVVLVVEKGHLHEHPMISEAVGYEVDNLEDGIFMIERILLP
jgi:nucleoside 2-deoxyribosyltransferase